MQVQTFRNSQNYEESTVEEKWWLVFATREAGLTACFRFPALRRTLPSLFRTSSHLRISWHIILHVTRFLYGLHDDNLRFERCSNLQKPGIW